MTQLKSFSPVGEELPGEAGREWGSLDAFQDVPMSVCITPLQQGWALSKEAPWGGEELG